MTCTDRNKSAGAAAAVRHRAGIPHILAIAAILAAAAIPAGTETQSGGKNPPPTLRAATVTALSATKPA